jgi:osmotically inducible protein OsmC
MANIHRTATAVWEGGLRRGNGHVSSHSGVLRDESYSFGTRFRQEPGTNPEELIAAAHAGCYSMALAGTLSDKGYKPESIQTHSTITLKPLDGGGFEITRSHLSVEGRVPEMDPATFEQVAAEADKGCPVSNLLRPGLEIVLEATLV